MVAHVQAQLDAHKGTTAPRKPTPPPPTPPEQREAGPVPVLVQTGRDTPKEQPRPAGHRARYAHTSGGALGYAGARFIADDVPPAALKLLIHAAEQGGLTPY